jgi:hypothetical protein
MPEALDALVDLADDVVAGIDGAVLAAVHVAQRQAEWVTVVTHHDAEALVDAERRDGGPTFTAYMSGRVTHLQRTNYRSGEWPEFSAYCLARRICSLAAFPITDAECLGVLTVYSGDYMAFGPSEIRFALQATKRAARLIVAASKPESVDRLSAAESTANARGSIRSV